ncbi:zinc finger protein 862-like [Bacillus rossius redtenbacheri]|uniref:zinc finger protein 862-like n=1 Tax=Bacillus rossius redtenbacheri TaxID=93214 RepID=UPI002FDDFE91
MLQGKFYLVPNFDDGESTCHFSSSLSVDPVDIGNCVGPGLSSKLSNEEKYKFPKENWTPSTSFSFPLVSQGNKNRKFRRVWFVTYPWLAYNAKENGAYCKICVLFGPDCGGKGIFCIKPLIKYKDAISDLKKHSSCKYHILAIQKSEDFCNVFEGKISSVDIQLDTRAKQLIESNRQKLLPIVKTIIFCGYRNESGGLLDETTDSEVNEGNFRLLLRFRIDAGDTILKEHIQNAPKNATFISMTSQNDLIECCGNIIVEKIIAKIQKARFFSVLADETTDSSHSEQMSISIRYVDLESHPHAVREDFIKFVKVIDLTGTSLSNTIVSVLVWII